MIIEEILQAVKSRKLAPTEAARLIGLSRSQASALNDSDPVAPASSGVSLEDIRELLISSFAKALYMEHSEVKCDQPFVDMGLDSIIGVEWIKEINRRLQLELPATTIYDYSTIDLFADYLAGIQGATGRGEKRDSAISLATVPDTSLGSSGGDLGLVVSRVHTLDEVSLTPWLIEPPNITEITVQVKASGINFPDAMCVNGLYPTMPKYPFVPGFEVAGVVVNKGEGVTEFDIGDEIVGLTGANLGGHAHFVNLPQDNAVRKPKNVSFAEACSLPVAFGIVHYAFELADLRAGEQVLIQTATGGCGLLAIQLARLKGATCIGTSSRDHKLEILERLNVEHAINYKTPFDKVVKDLTKGRGVDVVLNMLSGEAIQRGLNCLAPSGRYLEIAVHALKTSPKLSLSHLLQNQSFHSIDLRSLSLTTGRGAKEYLAIMVHLLEQERIVPIVSRVYPFAKIAEALEFVGQGQHIGKVVVSHECQQVIDQTDDCIGGMLKQEQRALRSRASQQVISVPVTNSPPARNRQSESQNKNEEPAVSNGGVAVIGMSGQFPKSASLKEFWRNISEKKNCVTEVSSSRWSVNEFYSANPQAAGKTNCKWLGELADADKFDPLFFSISPTEALIMDPQQRLILQSSWSCIEDAGIDPSTLSGTPCGVFVGVAPGDYGYISDESGLSSNSLMGQSLSILAARIAFFLNLKGPCITLDTACSSALVAITEACSHLQLGTCKLALAGGVNVMSGPGLHIMTSKAGMLSSDGRCYTFDQRANGFVPAEGVGIVLLKSLADAQRDGDSVQAVIRGWGVNQDGKTNGITAPSASSQTQLETGIYQKFGIDPGSITLMEAHGTGTRLGDPIEVRAITEAFRRYTNKQNYCALGSIKSNIGHAMAAAGIAGFIKIVLALKHKQLPPTVNFEQLNEHVEITDTPFYINTSLKPWPAEAGAPRRAAVSSFGFSGTNAHIVVEEGPQYHADRTALPCHLITLSARNITQLKVQVEQLLEYLAEHDAADLTDLSYTLLNGRRHFKCRLAAVADSVGQLRQMLLQWQGSGAKGVLTSASNESERKDSAREENKALLKLTDQCLTDCGEFRRTYRSAVVSSKLTDDYREKLAVLAANYIAGDAIEFGRLFDRKHCRPLSMPTYPFVKERYWLEPSPASTASRDVVAQSMAFGAALHPLLQRNTSDLHEQRFSSTFSGEELYLRDHVVSGSKVLPGVAYLEMARAAVERSVAPENTGGTSVTLKNVVWMRPVVVDAAREVHIGLTGGDNGEVEFEIYTAAHSDEGVQDSEVIHAQGKATSIATAESAERIDLALLRSQCNQSIDVVQCYAAFDAAGLEYGPAHRALTSVQVGTDAQSQSFVLAEVKLPACASETSDQYVLHPSVLDCALQACVGLSLGDPAASGAVVGPSLPFALEKLQIFDRSPADATAVIRPTMVRTASASPSSGFQKLDVDICDESGRVCVRLQGFTSRVFEGVASASGNGHDLEKQTLLFVPGWTAKPLAKALGGPVESGERWVLLDPLYKECISELEVRCPSVKWAVLPDNAGSSTSPAERVSGAGEQLFALVQKILLDKPKQTVLLQVIGTDPEGGDITSALSGLLKSAHQENQKFLGQLIELPRATSAVDLLAVVEENASETAKLDPMIRYHDGVREVANFKELTGLANTRVAQPWKDGGVYLITGGAGGLGLIFAREIASRVRDARIILTGRSELSAVKQAKVDALGQGGLGAHIEYWVLDVSDATAVERCIRSTIEQYGALNGIIHSAGVMKDNFIYKKTAEEFSTVLRAKVMGTVNLDQATQDVELDCFIMFSSVAGIFGNVGQSDYALANAFMDRYATHRSQLVEQNQRRGKTLSINWPLWADGGMAVDAAVFEQMRRQGLDVLTTAEGIDALFSAWAGNSSQVVVLAGERRKLKSLVGLANEGRRAPSHASMPVSSADAEAPAVAIDTAGLLEKVQRVLIQLISQQLNVKEADIYVDSELSEFGFDSISLTTFGNTLNHVYGLELSPTIFFEHPTVRRFAEYLAAEQTALMAERLGMRATQAAVVKSTQSIQEGVALSSTNLVNASKRRRRGIQLATVTHTEDKVSAPEPIAIIGMCGRFPGASDLDAFWENLKAGKDSITEIPRSRWDWQAIYGDPNSEENKTNIKWGGFIEGVDEFDPLFFNISPREAVSMDPQQRLLMTYTWRAIEDAGYAAQSLSGSKTAIFVGTASTGYSEVLAQAGPSSDGHDATSGLPSIGPNRMSYLLNLHGPSEPIETACSSSLIAIHRAVRAMQSGDCDMALAGGIQTIVTPWAHISFSRAGMLCQDGRCKTFSKDANGYVRGEGVGMLFLKKLSAAERDGDHIYGLIKGSSENHGGRANSLTAPNPKAQAELLKSAYREAKIDPRTVSYIETHGTGTSLGDPIEINGLKSAFADLYADGGDSEVKQAHCGLGSVKTNIGHLELAAGAAGVIKVLLQLKHRILVKSLHCEQVNPYIQLQDSPFYLVNETRPWEASKDASGRVLPRRAGVSSFGFGGVNAHVIIEEYCASQGNPPPAVTFTADLPALIVLSAKTEDRLREQAKQLLAHINHHSYTDLDLGNIAYTLQTGREAMDHRLAFAAATIADVKKNLSGYVERKGGAGECYQGEAKKNKELLLALNADEDASSLLRTWLQKGKYSKLLEFWVKGLALDWAALYEQGSAYAALQPKRISLPTYAFAKERYWPNSAQSSVTGSSAERLVKNKSGNAIDPVAAPPRPIQTYSLPKNLLMAREYWQESPQLLDDDILRTRAAGKGAQRVLILHRRLADLEILSQALLHYWRGSADKLVIESLETGGVDASEKSLDIYLETHVAPNVVFYVPALERSDSANPESELELLFAIARTLVRRAGTKSLDFYHCYAQCQGVANIYREGLAGLFRAIAMECPPHRYRNIACARLTDLADYKVVVSEWLSAAPSAQQVPAKVPEMSYRHGKRHVTEFSEWQPATTGLSSSPFRTGATYLMVGALGEVGMQMCLTLAREYQPRLIILSRRPDDRAKDSYLDNALSRLEQTGAQVLYRSVDITDAEKVAEVFRGLKTAVGAIHGVFHFARSVEDGLLHDKSFPAFKQTIAAKVAGTLNIDKATADEPLEFFIVFSSMAAFGITGSADYGYATAFQNAFVRDRNRKHLANERQGASIAFCWGQWGVDAYSNKDRDAALEKMGFDFIDAPFALHTMAIALHELQADLRRPGRKLGDVLGAIAVSDRQKVKKLYGLAVDDDRLTDLKRKATYQIKHHAETGADELSVDDLVALNEKLNGNDDAVRATLLDHSYKQLNRLYESLITNNRRI